MREWRCVPKPELGNEGGGAEGNASAAARRVDAVRSGGQTAGWQSGLNGSVARRALDRGS